MIDKQFYNENGYLVVKNLFFKAEVQRLLINCYDIIHHQVDRLQLTNDSGELFTKDEALFSLFEKDKDTLFNCGKAMQWLPELHRLGVDKNLFYYLTQLGISKPTISTRPVLFFHSKKLATHEMYYKIKAHRDLGSVQGSPNGVVVWFPLIPITGDVGPLMISPGSHLKKPKFKEWEKSFALEDETKDEDFYPVILEPGDVVIFNINLVHKSGNNTSDKIRWAANFRYSDLYSKNWIDRGYYTPYSYIVQKTADPYEMLH